MPGSRASICKSVFVILISSARTPPTTDLHRRMAAQRRRLRRADVVLRGVRLRVIAHDRTQTPHGNDRPRGVGAHGSPSCRNAHCGRRAPNPSRSSRRRSRGTFRRRGIDAGLQRARAGVTPAHTLEHPSGALLRLSPRNERRSRDLSKRLVMEDAHAKFRCHSVESQSVEGDRRYLDRRRQANQRRRSATARPDDDHSAVKRRSRAAFAGETFAVSSP